MDELDLAVVIGGAARKARRASGFTQAEVAERAGISVEFYSRIERGITMPSVPTLVRLARSLSVATDVLVGRMEVASVAPEERAARRRSAARGRLHRQLEAADARTVSLVSSIVTELSRRKRA